MSKSDTSPLAATTRSRVTRPATMDSGPALNNDAIDWKVVEQLRSRRRDGRSAFQRLLPIFIEESRQELADIRAHARAGDLVNLRLAAHKLKGSASVLGSLEVKQRARDVMEAADEGRTTHVDDIDLLELAVQRFNHFATNLSEEA